MLLEFITSLIFRLWKWKVLASIVDVSESIYADIRLLQIYLEYSLGEQRAHRPIVKNLRKANRRNKK